MGIHTHVPAGEQPAARLLVVDDEPSALKMIHMMLRKARYDVTTCSSGAEALNLIGQRSFDLVVTDAIMPTMTGYDLVKAIRRHPEMGTLPVLMLTRKRHRQDVKRAVEAGVSDYVLKPIDEHLLLDKVEMCLKKGSGKRHMYELQLSGPEAEAELIFGCRVVSISESDFSIRATIPVDETTDFGFKSMLFEQIGIPSPVFKFLACERKEGDSHFKNMPYEARFSFMGVPEQDLQKIRAWLQRETIKRRK